MNPTSKPRVRVAANGRPTDLEIKAGEPGKEVVATDANVNSALPAYLQGKATADLGIGADDVILPRIKLLQAISPEVTAFDNAKAGIFWHNVLGEPVTSPSFEGAGGFDFIVIKMRKKYLLMAPLGDPRGVLARAEDGINWSPPSGEFRVKLKNVKEEQVWKLAPTVRESGLAEFGSSVKDDSDSNPAAVAIYEYLIFMPERPDLSPIVMSLARSQFKKGKDLNSKITFRNAPLHGMRFRATAITEQGTEGPFSNYQFANAGWATEDEFQKCTALHDKFADYKVADEEGAAGAETDGAAAAGNKEF